MAVLGMVYGLVSALVLSLSALGAERILIAVRYPRRGVWLLALLGTISSSAILLGVAVHSTLLVQPELEASDEFLGLLLSPGAFLIECRKVVPATVNEVVTGIWIAWSMGFVFVNLWAWVQVRLSSRTWRYTILDDTKVYVSKEYGPGVFGHISPKVVVPPWLLSAPSVTRSIALEHERQHIRRPGSVRVCEGAG